MELRGANIGEPRKSRVPRNSNDPLQKDIATPTVTYTEAQLGGLTKQELKDIILEYLGV